MKRASRRASAAEGGRAAGRRVGVCGVRGGARDYPAALTSVSS